MRLGILGQYGGSGQFLGPVPAWYQGSGAMTPPGSRPAPATPPSAPTADPAFYSVHPGEFSAAAGSGAGRRELVTAPSVQPVSSSNALQGSTFNNSRTVYRSQQRRYGRFGGVGQLPPPPDDPVDDTTTPYECNWLEKLFDSSGCASASSITPPVPTPPPPAASIGTSCPSGTSTSDGTCTASGVDTNGSPIYVSATQGAAYHAQVVTSIQSQAAGSGYVDCTSIWNQFTSSQCPCTVCDTTEGFLIIGGVALAVLFVLIKASK